MKFSRFAEEHPLRIVTAALGVLVMILFCPAVSLIFNEGTVFGMLIGAGIVLLGIFGLTPRRIFHASYGWRRLLCRAALFCVTAGIVFACVIAVFIGIRAETAPKEDEPVTVIVLGCYVSGETPGPALRQRMNAAADYLTVHPDALCILAGGQGRGESISEAEAMRRYLTERGIGEERFYLEDRSVNTEENLQYSAELIRENGLPQTAAIVTHGYHQGRAALEAVRAGLSPRAVSVACHPLVFPTYFLREILGVAEYYLIEIPRQVLSSAG